MNIVNYKREKIPIYKEQPQESLIRSCQESAFNKIGDYKYNLFTDVTITYIYIA